MLELCAIVAVMLFAVYAANARNAVTYSCPQCGSKNGDHANSCSWK